ncbi:LOW QUALITY PROTEIN: hypothetical protein RvY_11143 [Ramazzottius varieornatus]|uniref:Uncharacterized protein n=1 Tax=Ramazzottius varieornatus TaxID=947166 RepID=A0A1D1VKK8_RAMVA|nr:LOW QUALITY PROTEIN: hypothetical protein RvY_11143 [Ramazzottius varieornatus]
MEEGLEEAVRAKTGPMKVVSKILCLMHDHYSLFLLKNCLCLPKLLYILRCSAVWKFPEVLKEFDEVVRSSLAEITNIQMSAEPWRQATFPVGLGGLGIRRTEEVALPAFLASIHSVQKLVLSILPGAASDSETDLALTRWTFLSCVISSEPGTFLF